MIVRCARRAEDVCGFAVSALDSTPLQPLCPKQPQPFLYAAIGDFTPRFAGESRYTDRLDEPALAICDPFVSISADSRAFLRAINAANEME